MYIYFRNLTNHCIVLSFPVPNRRLISLDVLGFKVTLQRAVFSVFKLHVDVKSLSDPVEAHTAYLG